MRLSLALASSIAIPALITLAVSHLLAVGVFFRLRSRNRNLYRSLLLDPFKDVEWTSELHELCSEGDMILVRKVRRLRTVRQIAFLALLGALVVGAVLEYFGI
jgi:predicted nucleic acid-binding Zn ribbon protein